MSAPEVIEWDWRGQPDLDQLAAALRRLSGGGLHLTQVETGTDDYAIVLADRPVPSDEAYNLWADEDQKGDHG